jgi:hypothetical protein
MLQLDARIVFLSAGETGKGELRQAKITFIEGRERGVSTMDAQDSARTGRLSAKSPPFLAWHNALGSWGVIKEGRPTSCPSLLNTFGRGLVFCASAAA